ncbi:hypothetical protein OJF2_05960 [Aquisphaera giovannonii]|uniref:NHL repeat protein n=1 Tax=Aquisphaera giovannonii TaxID=406548 RepID=A0A5B9VW02_9BACT|nr:hypothetical protein [Aquisphaera giovannonii]QEH32127.1 hypothetical protein OJF2_05960 [Aquisphaera giovannonii]
MRRVARRLALLLGAALTSAAASARPGSGIVVDDGGRIFFVDTGAGVWIIDSRGRLARHGGEGFHWLAIDRRGGFAGRDMPRDAGGQLPVLGRDPTLIRGLRPPARRRGRSPGPGPARARRAGRRDDLRRRVGLRRPAPDRPVRRP